jgi:hypothetical protein
LISINVMIDVRYDLYSSAVSSWQLLDDLLYNGVEYSLLISIDVILLLDDLFYNGVEYSMLISTDVMTGVRYDLYSTLLDDLFYNCVEFSMLISIGVMTGVRDLYSTFIGWSFLQWCWI